MTGFGWNPDDETEVQCAGRKAEASGVPSLVPLVVRGLAVLPQQSSRARDIGDSSVVTGDRILEDRQYIGQVKWGLWDRKAYICPWAAPAK
jgi:hypothetical protein